MAQLSDDCFAHDGGLLSIEDALELLKSRVSPSPQMQDLPLSQALGSVLAEEQRAGVAVPPCDNSAVDGYAICFDDLATQGRTCLPVVARITAGDQGRRGLCEGQAARIFTGAPMPARADTVFMQEDCHEGIDDRGQLFVELPPGLKQGANRRKAGEDVQAGESLFPRGHKIRPVDLGLLASVGISRVKVYRALKVAVFSTGNELIDSCGRQGKPLKTGQIFDSNRYTLIGLLQRMGLKPSDLGVLPDNEELIYQALGKASEEHDLVITSGGVSVGDEDHVKKAVEQQGSLYAWRLAIKPGRPVAFGQIGGTPLIALPGNPVAVVVTFLHLVEPFLWHFGGQKEQIRQRQVVVADFEHKKKPRRQEWLRVVLEEEDTANGRVSGDPGYPRARKHPREGAGILSSVCHSDGFVVLPEDCTGVKAGDRVTYISFQGYGL